MKLVVLCALGLAACRGPSPRPPGAPPPPHVSRGELDATLLLAEPAARAARLGASPLVVVAAGAVVEGERSGAFVEVAADTCLLAYARGAATVEDVDVAAISDDGNALAADERPDAHPTLILCPPHPARVFVALHVVSGEGLVAVGAQAVAREKAVEVARALGARQSLTGAAARSAEAWPGLDDRVRVRRVAMGGKWEEIRKVALPLDARVPAVTSLPIEPDSCLDVLVVPDEDVAGLDVEALDGEGRMLARAREEGPVRTLTLCSTLAVSGTLVVRPHVGAGLAAVVLGRSRQGAAKELSLPFEVVWTAATLALDAARAARAIRLGKAGYAAPSASATGSAIVGRRTLVSLDVPPTCARIDVIGGAPLALVRARAWDDHAGLAGDGEGRQGATLFECGKKRVTVEVEANGRGGPFAVDVRREPWASPAFAPAPLAASRMLGRFTDTLPWVAPGVVASARSWTVDPAHRVEWDETIPAGRCALVAAGVEGAGAGIELRVFAPPGANEVDRAHGETSALVTACAEDLPRTVRIELGAVAGKLDVVVGTRLK